MDAKRVRQPNSDAVSRRAFSLVTPPEFIVPTGRAIAGWHDAGVVRARNPWLSSLSGLALSSGHDAGQHRSEICIKRGGAGRLKM